MVRRQGATSGLSGDLTVSLVVVGAAGVACSATLWALAATTWNGSIDTAWFGMLCGTAATLTTTLVVHWQRVLGGSTHDRLKEFERRATHDELTGLPSRDMIFERLERALVDAYRHDRVVGLLFLDIDGFKAINDTLGHETGDDFLCAFATRLAKVVRANDVVGRLGGDEFVVVVQGVERETAVRAVAENLAKAFANPLIVGDREFTVRPSIGVATSSRHRPATAEELLSHADQAMYRAKREQTGIRVFDDAQRREVVDRREVRRALVPALAEGQFRVHYQPIISMAKERVVGVEALIRWQHPHDGIIGPDRFLPEAAEAGMLGRLGELVLRESAAQLGMWNHLYPQLGELSVSVNLAESQLLAPDFCGLACDIVAWAGLRTRQVALEVSEELLERRAREALPVLTQLRDAGFRLVIDNFGSSSAALKRVRGIELFSHLKIDRSIVEAMHDDDIARAVVDATVSMARALDLTVTAEGVERQDQRDLLRSLGVDQMQGFLFRRPLAPDDLEETTLTKPGLVSGAIE